MRTVDRRERLLSNVARLRRVERELPPNRDLVAVRVAMEDELGGIVSLRMAARLLGVSHTALRRWTAEGDLPLVFAANGRQGVPVDALLDLYEKVNAERIEAKGRRHLLEAALSKGRDCAELLDPLALVPEATDMEGHRRADMRALAYHRALAARLRQPIVDDALRQLWKWRAQEAIDPRYADRWEEILGQPVAEVRRVIGEDSEAANALRQTSPFAGMLSEAERRKILEEIR
jgi:hypothetical protein